MNQTNHDIIVRRHPSSRAFVLLNVMNSYVWETIKKKFTFKAPNYFFSPKYKSGAWNGDVSLLKPDGTLAAGLVPRLLNIADKMNYRVLLDGINIHTDYDEEKVRGWVNTLDLPFAPRDYQFRAFYDSITKKMNGVVSITGSGKSLIIYLIARFLHRTKKRVLIVVPTVQLVEQLFSDFESYNHVEIYDHVQKIRGGLDKNFQKPIVISTWQSIYKLPAEHYDSIDAIIIDECHQADSKNLVDIQSNCRNALYRVGLSGTIPIGTDVGYYNLIGLFGEFTEYLTYQEAFDRGYISPMKLNVKLLEYPEADRKHIFDNKKDYRYELDFVQKHKLRNLYLMRLIKSFEKNTLVLFTNIESHGRLLHDYLKEHLRQKTIFYIDGSVKVQDREDIRQAMERQDDVILLASYGTFSAGINVKNIHNVVFASAYRSEVKTFQSIGRGLRTLENKNLQVYDIVDILSYREGRSSYNNYLIDQYAERQSQYKDRDFVIEKETIQL